MYVYGKNVVRELLENNKKINKVYIWDKINDKNLISDIQKLNISIKYVSKLELDRLANGVHQGIIVDIPDFKYSELDDLLKNDIPFIVMLDHITDPHNFGAIIRTCEAAGVDGIIIPKDRSVDINSTVMKTSAGTLNNMKICRVSNLVDTINKLKQKGLWIVSADMNGEAYTDINYSIPICLIVGNEGEGISRLILKNSDYIVSLPMKGLTNSLNVSVATGILIYEILKTR